MLRIEVPFQSVCETILRILTLHQEVVIHKRDITKEQYDNR